EGGVKRATCDACGARRIGSVMLAEMTRIMVGLGFAVCVFGRAVGRHARDLGGRACTRDCVRLARGWMTRIHNFAV
ncbi:hypothetical protein, partial [Brevibacillus sp. SIMBA_040]|uniref:hypothetical protein n=1 Tax=Brevibacillus sp. SIMBA_040 TaxID=3085781 RepID=UPI00397D5E4E